ncbi:Na+/H+ antiporter NhaC [Siminovitchia fortis]|nr:Na+/H+ antiporter NhaC [Siminovitchia fortis]
METEIRKPTFLQSIIVLVIVLLIVLVSVVVFKTDPHIPLFFACAVCVIFAKTLKFKWQEIENTLFEGLRIGLLPILIMLLIGMTIGAWIASGTVPYIIYLGLNFISAEWFLPATLLSCILMSVCTGSSWTTLGTIGIASMGIGLGLGIDPGLTAGAVISGAYFGDKISPMSDATNFAATVAGTTLFEHINSTIFTILPATIISLILFTVFGLKDNSGTFDQGTITQMSSTLEGMFYFNPVLLLPPLFLVVVVLKKIPALVGMSISVFAGGVFAIVFQGANIPDIINYLHYGYVGNSGVEVIDELVSKGGMESMLWTISLILIALPLGGLLNKIGVLEVILSKITELKSRFSLIMATLLTNASLNFVVGDSFFAALLTAKTYTSAYDKNNIDRKVLSRSIEDGGMFAWPTVPWGVNAIFIVSTLGVSVSAYLPYYFLGMFTPIISMILAITGIGVFYTDRNNQKTDEAFTDRTG